MIIWVTQCTKQDREMGEKINHLRYRNLIFQINILNGVE